MRLTFVTFTDLKAGRGTETVLFNLLKYKPEDIEATVLYTDDHGNNPLILSDDAVKDLIKDSKQIKIQCDIILYYPDYAVKNTKLKFLFVASLSSGKGLDILLPLIEKMNNSEVEFHIAGGGELADKIKTNKRIIYHGILNDTDLARLYRECDVFIFPSHADTFSIVTLQALSSGLYVMCSDYLKGNFDDFENKYLEYLPLDIEQWYSRVNEIINNNSIIKHDKSEEYSYVKDNYDWSVISTKFYGYMAEYYNESKGINR